MKKASLIVVNYNDKIHIGRAISSCINQSWKNIETIVVDDGSDQATREIYKNFGDKIKLVQLERSQNEQYKRTVSRALNAGLDNVSGDVFAVLGSDDYFDLLYVEKLIKLDTDIAICNWRTIGLERKEISIQKHWNFKDHPLKNYLFFNMLSHECMLCDRKLIDEVGKYDIRLPRSQDCDWIVRACLKNYEWKHIPAVLVNVEKHEADQQKNYASVHGKTLWSLKNNVNFRWILNYLKNGDPMGILAFYFGIYDFMNNDQWQDDYEKSEFKHLVHEFIEQLQKERGE